VSTEDDGCFTDETLVTGAYGCSFVYLLISYISCLFCNCSECKALGKDVGELATHSISQVLDTRPFRGADSDCSLKQACQHLLATNQDFLPIVFSEDMRVLACVSYTNILEFLVTNFREQRRLFDDSITDLAIGTYAENVVTVHYQQTLDHALEIMRQHNLSALPVLDDAKKIVAVYSRSDITFLTKATDAEDAVNNLNLTLADILSQHRQDVTTPDALRTCSASHTLQAIFESFAQLRFNRLFVVDHDEHLLGVVSAKDLVKYFLMGGDD
jgi:5'-AMP-activated protein kinase regulatory gamma subunit